MSCRLPSCVHREEAAPCPVHPPFEAPPPVPVPGAFLHWLDERASVEGDPARILNQRQLLWEAFSAGAITALKGLS